VTTAAAPPAITLAELAALVRQRRPGTGRLLVGIAGPPGAGKSTVARQLAGRLGECAAVVGQDGFHLAHAVLERSGQVGRKGAPETFDAHGFVAALERVRNERGHHVWLPGFDRSIEDSIAQAIDVAPHHDVVIVEGNYLLLDQPPWGSIRDLLGLAVYVEIDDETRVRRLVDRHVSHGRSPADAAAFVGDSDERNARLVAAGRSRADVVLRR